MKRAAGLVIAIVLGCLGPPRGAGAEPAPEMSAAERAFAHLYEVAKHPRCVNCHGTSRADDERVPTIGEGKAAPHPMNITVRHNPGGHPLFGITCTGCHGTENSQLRGGPPGAWSASADWQMPEDPIMALSRTMTKYDLCRGWQRGVRLSFKAHASRCKTQMPSCTTPTPSTLFVHHIENDGLIAWAFTPGLDRDTPPGDLNRLKTAARIWAPMIENQAWCETLKETPPAVIEKGGPRP